MELYEKNGNILYILNILKKYTDSEHMLTSVDIQKKVKEIYNVDIDPRTVRRNINLLKEKFGYDISSRQENGQGYYISKNPETDFEHGEIRAIIDNFSYANYIVPSIAKSIIKKCKNLQNIYENDKLKDYEIFSRDSKTQNMEVIKNIEDISEAIQKKCKITFDYCKYAITNKLEEQISSTPVVSPFAIVYDKQQFYLIAVKEGNTDFYYYRLDRIKNVNVLPDKISIKKTKSQIQEYATSTVEMFGGEMVEIEADVSMYLLNDVIERFGKDITIIKKSDDEFKLIVNANELGFRIWTMRNMDLVEVIRPLSLRTEIENVIKTAKNKYGI